jgi:hypothetical protein
MNWASKTYELNYGPVKKMINTGYHTVEEWRAVLF